MALGRRRPPDPDPGPPTNLPTLRREPQALVAAAAQIKLDGDSVFRMRTNDQEWQNEAWRHYDICGELRFVANRHASALSRAQLYIADVDDDGQVGALTKDPDMRALGRGLFGSQAGRARVLKSVGLQQYIAGECYIVALAGRDPTSDEWFVVSRKEIRKRGGTLQVKAPLRIGGDWVSLRPNQDLTMRVWHEHPRLTDVADSPTRAVLPTLREIERLSMLTASQIDSRLISAGLLLLPEGIDFPHADDKPGGVQGLVDMILEAARAQLQGAGTAAGLVPILATVPIDVQGRGGVANSFAHVKFDTPLTDAIATKLDQAIRRLALGLDVAPEDLLGQGDANHWASWQVEESSIKMFIEPALVDLCGGIDDGYLKAAAKALGKDPAKFATWYDISALTVRPNRQADAVTLFEQDALSADALRTAGAWDDSDKPTAKELTERRLWTLVQLQPALIADPQVAAVLGLPLGIQAPGAAPLTPPETDQGGAEGGQQPAQIQGLPNQTVDQRALPAMPDTTTTPPAQTGLTAAGVPYRREGTHLETLLPGAEQVVLRALELAGGRLLDRHSRGRYADISRHDLHTHVRVKDRDHAGQLMAGAFTHIPALANHFGIRADELEQLLDGYARELLVRGYPHTPELLTTVLAKAHLRPVPA